MNSAGVRSWLASVVALIVLPAPSHGFADASPPDPVVVPPLAMITGEYWEAPRDEFQRLSGTPTPGVRATVFPQPAEAGAPVYVVVRHPDTTQVLRIRVDLGEGLPIVHEGPWEVHGLAVAEVLIPENHPADSIHVTVWLPAETLTRSVAIARYGRDMRTRFDSSFRIDELPEALTRFAPAYPQHVDAEGTVMVQALVGADGLVYATRVVQSVPGLDEAAEAAVRRWRFKPARAGDRPVGIWVAVPVRFSRR